MGLPGYVGHVSSRWFPLVSLCHPMSLLPVDVCWTANGREALVLFPNGLSPSGKRQVKFPSLSNRPPPPKKRLNINKITS